MAHRDDHDHDLLQVAADVPCLNLLVDGLIVQKLKKRHSTDLQIETLVQLSPTTIGEGRLAAREISELQ